MTVADETRAESRVFEADVAKLLHLMVHSVYSDKSVFLRELISNAADAYEKLRYDAIANPALLGDDPKPRITLTIDAENRTLTVEDNGIGMSRDEMVEALGTIARSGTRAFLERVEAWVPADVSRVDVVLEALSHGVSPIADSFSRNSSWVSLRNSQKLRSGNFTPMRPYGVRPLRRPIRN